MFLGVVNFILCVVKHICVCGVNIISVDVLNCVGSLSITDLTVDGVKYGWYASIFRGAMKNILAMGRYSRGVVLPQCGVEREVVNGSK